MRAAVASWAVLTLLVGGMVVAALRTPAEPAPRQDPSLQRYPGGQATITMSLEAAAADYVQDATAHGRPASYRVSSGTVVIQTEGRNGESPTSHAAYVLRRIAPRQWSGRLVVRVVDADGAMLAELAAP